MNGKPGVLAVLARDSQNSAKFSIANEHLYEPGQRITEYAESLEARATVERLAVAADEMTRVVLTEFVSINEFSEWPDEAKKAVERFSDLKEELRAALAAFRGDA